MNMKKSERIVLPALRGIMGDWIYYSCLMNLREISQRISYANEIHRNKNLSDMIQRVLDSGRSDKIANYIKTQDERFFNSLVVATYGGKPNWSAIDNLQSRTRKELISEIAEETINSVGFLSLSGEEKLFAVDGQHRLSGIKKAIKDGIDQDPLDEVSVIFVAHKATAKGLERTRRLFTTLNKTAKPVSKGDIIALDEDDVMAICVRRLIEETDLFSGDRIAFVATNNMPATNLKSLTTIGNLYDVLAILFTRVQTKLQEPNKSELQKARPSDEKLSEYFELAKTYFALLAKQFPSLAEFFSVKETESVVGKYRGSHGGSALFRPIGLAMFTEIVAQMSKVQSFENAIRSVGELPSELNEIPLEGLMWDSSSRRISNGSLVTLREVLLYMLDNSKFKPSTLIARYRRDLGDEDAVLPGKVV